MKFECRIWMTEFCLVVLMKFWYMNDCHQAIERRSEIGIPKKRKSEGVEAEGEKSDGMEGGEYGAGRRNGVKKEETVNIQFVSQPLFFS